MSPIVTRRRWSEQSRGVHLSLQESVDILKSDNGVVRGQRKSVFKFTRVETGEELKPEKEGVLGGRSRVEKCIQYII
jgi:hypothetical protein